METAMSEDQHVKDRPRQKALVIHPEIHKEIGRRALEADSRKQDILHRILCEAMGRTDLLKDRSHLAASA
jgi:hypothetical protein